MFVEAVRIHKLLLSSLIWMLLETLLSSFDSPKIYLMSEALNYIDDVVLFSRP